MNDEINTGEILLTPRQREVMDLVSTGLQDKEIAYILGISLNTVKNHLKNIYSKNNVDNRVEALLKYKQIYIKKMKICVN